MLDEANKNSLAHGCIHSDMVMFMVPEQPILRADWGIVQRKMTLDLYSMSFPMCTAAIRLA